MSCRARHLTLQPLISFNILETVNGGQARLATFVTNLHLLHRYIHRSNIIMQFSTCNCLDMVLYTNVIKC